jgi:hypothetical protein
MSENVKEAAKLLQVAKFSSVNLCPQAAWRRVRVGPYVCETFDQGVDVGVAVQRRWG